MADLKEIELPIAADCGWVRGLDANGNPIKLNKADMVELIRREMPVATSDRSGLADNSFFKSKDTLVNDVNCDDIISHGEYLNFTGNGVGNSNFPVNYGVLLVFGNNPKYMAQISVGTNGYFHIRLMFDGYWSIWKSVSFAL